jgi:hypothetical protein
LDKDFGELAFKRGIGTDMGIVMVRVHPALPEAVASLAVAVFEGEEIIGEFVVAEPGWQRRRSLR